MANATASVIGFIGLGVMGGAMCRNMALKHGADVIAYDANPAAFQALEGTKARRVAGIAEIAALADIVFLSLPGGPAVEQVCLGPQGLAAGARRPAVIVDLSTTTVASARFCRRTPGGLRRSVRRCPGGPHARSRATGRTQHHGWRRC